MYKHKEVIFVLLNNTALHVYTEIGCRMVPFYLGMALPYNNHLASDA